MTYTKEEVQMFRSMDERGFVLEEHQELAVLKEDLAVLIAEIARLRTSLERIRDVKPAWGAESEEMYEIARAALNPAKD